MMFGRKLDINNFTLDMDVLRNATLIHVQDNIRVHVENHKGIIEYSVDKVRINTRNGVVSIVGSDLYLKEIDMTDILVFGKIKSIVYP
jgi:sporulation protein YqfC